MLHRHRKIRAKKGIKERGKWALGGIRIYGGNKDENGCEEIQRGKNINREKVKL